MVEVVLVEGGVELGSIWLKGVSGASSGVESACDKGWELPRGGIPNVMVACCFLEPFSSFTGEGAIFISGPGSEALFGLGVHLSEELLMTSSREAEESL